MEEIKNAVSHLEQAVVKLETALHQTKKDKEQAIHEVEELKNVIRKTYMRIDNALATYHQNQGGE